MDLTKDSPVLIIDALNLFMRHFAANPTMNAQGQHVGGAVGFLKAIRLLADKVNPKEIVVVWEGGGSTRRRTIYSGYKANRKPQKLNRFYGKDLPDSTNNRDYQIALIIEMLRCTPVSQIYISDCEADDVIGYLAKYRYSDGCVIVSSDKDFYQLLSPNIRQWSPGQRAFVTPEAVLQKYGIPVHNFCVARCFCGDKSDNIEGVQGAGFKTLAKRVPEITMDSFISVDDILKLCVQRAPTSKIKLYHNAIAASDIVRRNWKLMYLDVSNLAATQISKIDYNIDTFQPSRNKIGLMRILVREGLSKFDADSFFMSLNFVSRT
ncbi:MAG: hypothetical protein CME70_06065 [Halobacteriovorax sp.]|nr:hypothetical protein [Halobacteriovorax sp.]